MASDSLSFKNVVVAMDTSSNDETEDRDPHAGRKRRHITSCSSFHESWDTDAVRTASPWRRRRQARPKLDEPTRSRCRRDERHERAAACGSCSARLRWRRCGREPSASKLNSQLATGERVKSSSEREVS